MKYIASVSFGKDSLAMLGLAIKGGGRIMEIDKKTCVICKKPITDEKEYICTECYNKSLEDLKDNELYQELKNNNIPIWIIGAMLVFALKDKGE